MNIIINVPASINKQESETCLSPSEPCIGKDLDLAEAKKHRMKDERYPKIAFNGYVHGTRKRGRP